MKRKNNIAGVDYFSIGIARFRFLDGNSKTLTVWKNQGVEADVVNSQVEKVLRFLKNRDYHEWLNDRGLTRSQ